MKSEFHRRISYGWRWTIIHLASSIPLESCFYCVIFAFVCAFLSYWSHNIWTITVPFLSVTVPQAIIWCKVLVRIAQVALAVGAAKFLSRMLQICYRKYYSRAQLRFS